LEYGEKMKILFLDIDGVLNSVRSAVALHGYPYTEVCHEKFDEVALGLIRQLCEKTGTRICLSSTWRYTADLDTLAKDLDLPILWSTPILARTNKELCRGDEIKEFVTIFDHLDRLDKYAIVDDDSDMLEEQLPFFVKADNREGLSYTNYEKLLELLE
jgi:hypothetical protein